ncbi:retrovirus-related Pol polyprotein from transposon 17.6 [Nephila pilipes]|uniref:Retrovirus-related Pol polyprotein from transposon 17.6 n=1 Tax=Nephila pilipes TaxID=299642 RepID=A0A8X6QEK1_NEPPI|nr:retrovirus-related Pol polyprotein from transposon 17.6 [Nephila pilipes]
METFLHPVEINFRCTNLAEAWNKWVPKFYNYFMASEKNEKDDKVKIAILLNLLNDDVVEIFNAFNQQEGQQVDIYLTELKTLPSACEFGDQEEGLIRDRLALGIRERSLLERISWEVDLTLKKAVDFLRSAETSRQQLETVTSSIPKVHKVRKDKPKPLKKQNQHRNVFKFQKCGREHSRYNCLIEENYTLSAKIKIISQQYVKTHNKTVSIKKVDEIENSMLNLELYIDSVHTLDSLDNA